MRYPIKEMLKNEKLKQDMIIGVIIFCQGHEGRSVDKQAALKAYKKIRKERGAPWKENILHSARSHNFVL